MGSIHRGRRQYIHFILFVLPALFFVLLATDIPFVLNMVYSLFEWNGISKSATFVGLEELSFYYAVYLFLCYTRQHFISFCSTPIVEKYFYK